VEKISGRRNLIPEAVLEISQFFDFQDGQSSALILEFWNFWSTVRLGV